MNISVLHGNDRLDNNEKRDKEAKRVYLVQRSKALRSSSQSLQRRYRLLHSTWRQGNLLPQRVSTKHEIDQKVYQNNLLSTIKCRDDFNLKNCEQN